MSRTVLAGWGQPCASLDTAGGGGVEKSQRRQDGHRGTHTAVPSSTAPSTGAVHSAGPVEQRRSRFSTVSTAPTTTTDLSMDESSVNDTAGTALGMSPLPTTSRPVGLPGRCRPDCPAERGRDRMLTATVPVSQEAIS